MQLHINISKLYYIIYHNHLSVTFSCSLQSIPLHKITETGVKYAFFPTRLSFVVENAPRQKFSAFFYYSYFDKTRFCFSQSVRTTSSLYYNCVYLQLNFPDMPGH